MKIRWSSNKVKIFTFTSALIIFGGFSVFLLTISNHKTEIVYHKSAWNEFAPEIDRAVENRKDLSPVDLRTVLGGVVPHHIPITIPKLVEFYERLKLTQNIKNIIVIGPDHTDAGITPITVSNASFFTAYGQVNPIKKLPQELQNMQLAKIEEPPFDLEHSVGSQIMIISRIFSDVRVTPIILRSDTSKSQAEALGRKLSEWLDEHTIIIASVDFSHYLSTDQASGLDKISVDVIRNLDENALSLIEADSNATMRAFVTAMNEKKVHNTKDVFMLNTNDFMQNSDYTTGYIFGYWGK